VTTTAPNSTLPMLMITNLVFLVFIFRSIVVVTSYLPTTCQAPTNDDNIKLSELRTARKEMADSKSPRLDGIPVKFLEICGMDKE